MRYETIHRDIGSSRTLRHDEISRAQDAINEYCYEWKKLVTFHPAQRSFMYPKLHYLFAHALDFVRLFPMGLGISCEQGNESLHKENKKMYEQICAPMNKDQMKKLLEQSLLKRLVKLRQK